MVLAIQGSTTSVYSYPVEINKEQFNIFLIPAKEGSGEEEFIPDYNFSISLLTVMSSTLPVSLSNPGPYIITMYHPISKGVVGTSTDIMYLDLTNFSVGVIPELVSIYKSKIQHEDIEGVEKLKDMRLALFQILLLLILL